MPSIAGSTRIITIPQRLDALAWSTWHTRLVLALGITWLLDGLEGSLGGSLAGALKSHDGLSLTDAQLGLASSIYLAGAVLGSIVLGSLADRFGRRRIFFWTLFGYLCATSASGASWNLHSFAVCRFLTGVGIGGEYAAVNSTIDELIPARLRGRVDIAINGTFWLGIVIGSLVTGAFLSGRFFPIAVGWRFAFLAGLPVGLLVLLLRRTIPESPRWLLSRGREQEALRAMQSLQGVAWSGGIPIKETSVNLSTGLTATIRLLAGPYRQRSLVCLGLMTAQALFYNSVFFSLTLVLLRYYGLNAEHVGYAFLPIAAANFLGPMLLGSMFDTVGRRAMTGGTFIVSGLLLLAGGVLFWQNMLTTFTQLAFWAAIFLVASTGASAAYLNASELFPQKIRATAIAIFYSAGTLIGGVSGPLVFGRIVGSGSRGWLLVGYGVGALFMVVAGVVQAVWGVAAEGQPLEALTFDARSAA